MNYKLLHIFRDTPFGRETFLHSLYFCKTIHATPVVYIPENDKFLFYFNKDVVQVDLDPSYLGDPETAEKHARALLEEAGLQPVFYKPKNYTASSLPDVSTHFDFFNCPRSVSDISTKIGLGHIGPKVRRVIKHTTFPVVISSPVFKPWKCISVLFGGSDNAVNAMKLGVKMSLASGYDLNIFTLMEKGDQAYYKDFAQKEAFWEMADRQIRNWHFYEKNDFDSMLYDMPHDSLIVMGAYGHGMIKDVLFGSKLEKIQSTLSNNLLITGPNTRISLR
ncbi:universal stress protein [Desulfospira joergensenii]|uniref:universal stress protein n=1 Tax=Desulfospira joergensenii TaxID=53329 RepID=UPI0003B773A2|nr:universal stress protein [Desulfospira joergensenii]